MPHPYPHPPCSHVPIPHAPFPMPIHHLHRTPIPHAPPAYLPWAHVFGQTAELHSLLSTGSCMAIVSNREQILDSLAIVRPTMIASVPVLFNRVYDGVMKRMREGSAVTRVMFSAAMGVARRRNELLEFGKPGKCLYSCLFYVQTFLMFLFFYKPLILTYIPTPTHTHTAHPSNLT